MPEIRFAPPDADAPGYLKRAQRALAFEEMMASSEGMTVRLLDEMVDFLSTYISYPENRDEAHEALMEASQNQFNDLLASVVGASKKKLSPETKQEP